jgi:hypothetical protein
MFTPDQYKEIAKSYDSAASDPFVPEDKRREFAKRAEWFHYLGAREKGNVSNALSGQDSSRSPNSAFAPFLTTLWVIGAALYLISTLLFINAIGLFSDDNNLRQVSEVIRPTDREPKTASVEEKAKGALPAAERPHAISPNQPSYEAPELMVPKETESQPTAGPVITEPASAAPSTAESEMLKVTEAAAIRNGPSTTAKLIGTVTPGAELEAQEHENGWIQFVDPSSGNSGWIQSDFVAKANGQKEANGATQSAVQEAPTPQQKKPVKKAKRPQSQPKLGQRFADLPEDQDFLADRGTRRKGLLARRRMLREGLMSPGFRPPQ